MNARPFVIVTTRVPPAACGIGAYSVQLRKHWPEQDGPVEFLVVDGAAEAALPLKGDRATQFNARGRQLTRALERIGTADVLLHYAGRAYQRFGCPAWMPSVLAQWKKRFPGSRLMIFFHELPGEMRMTSRHYWLGELNARIIRRLAPIADVLVTNTEHHRARLEKIARRGGIHLLPVGSNIEVAPAAAGQQRVATDFVVFGMSFGRLQTLGMFAEAVQAWQAAGLLTRLHLIGPGGDLFSSQADELIASSRGLQEVVVKHGMLPAERVSELLATARFALTNVTTETWGKSGAFMACAAHRCAVVIHGARPATVPLSCAVQAEEVSELAAEEIDARTAALEQWYHANAEWPVIARRMAALWEGK